MDSGNDATSNMSAKIFLHKPADTTYTDATWTTIWFDRTSGHVETGQGGGRRLSSADVDAIQFHWASGNFKAQGSIQLIGIKKA